MRRLLALLLLCLLPSQVFAAGTITYQGGVVTGGGGNLGDVVGPSVSVDNGIVRYDGTTGKLVQSYTSNTPTCGDTGICTFVAPVLGTPTSGVGTNLTGIPAASILAGSFGAGAYVVSTSLQAATIELGHATDTTIARERAGVASIEGMLIGYMNIPQNSKSAAYTTVLADSGYHILHPTADNNARTHTIDSNANVAYPIGTAITFVNQINTVTIAITSDTMTFLPGGGTGSRTLAANGIATALKVGTTSWIITGSGLT